MIEGVGEVNCLIFEHMMIHLNASKRALSSILKFLILFQSIESAFHELFSEDELELWLSPTLCNDQTFNLTNKAKSFSLKGESFFNALYNILNNEKEEIHHDACLRVVHQFIHEISLELHEDEQIRLLSLAFPEPADQIHANEVFKIHNLQHMTKILQAFTVLWTTIDDDRYESFKAATLSASKCNKKDFFNLAFYLRERRIAQFQNDFEEILEKSRKTFGDYHMIAMKPETRLLIIITEKLELFKLSEFIILKFPFIGVNSTVMTSIYDTQDFQVINTKPFTTKLVQELVRNLVEFQTICKGNYDLFSLQESSLSLHFDIQTIENFLDSHKKLTKTEANELKNFLFGRNAKVFESNFEIILSTHGASHLIDKIWKLFELSLTPEVLSLVRNGLGNL